MFSERTKIAMMTNYSWIIFSRNVSRSSWVFLLSVSKVKERIPFLKQTNVVLFVRIVICHFKRMDDNSCRQNNHLRPSPSRFSEKHPFYHERTFLIIMRTNAPQFSLSYPDTKIWSNLWSEKENFRLEAHISSWRQNVPTTKVVYIIFHLRIVDHPIGIRFLNFLLKFSNI